MEVMLITHILIAISGIVLSTILYFKPKKTLYNASSIGLIATLGTGIILVFQSKGHLVSACIGGLVYTAFVASSLFFAKRKLSSEQVEVKD